MTRTPSPEATTRHRTRTVLRGLVVVGLLVDAAVHIHLAPEYALAFPAGVGGGTLFRVQAACAVVAAIGVLARDHRLVHAIALLVAGSAFAAVVISRYMEVPSIGPVPAMYEPLWFFEKSLSAVAEGMAALAALALLVRPHRAGGRR